VILFLRPISGAKPPQNEVPKSMKNQKHAETGECEKVSIFLVDLGWIWGQKRTRKGDPWHLKSGT
jgi:hypothetical protein